MDSLRLGPLLSQKVGSGDTVQVGAHHRQRMAGQSPSGSGLQKGCRAGVPLETEAGPSGQPRVCRHSR